MRRLRPFAVLVVAILVGVGLDLLIGYSPFPGYAAVLGLVGAASLTVVAKMALGPLLHRAPDYYPEDRAPDEGEGAHG